MMASKLKQGYYRQLLPALAAIGLAAAARSGGLLATASPANARTVGIGLFVLAIAFAAALPVFIRATFAHRVRLDRGVEEAAFIRFQQRLVRAALMTPYLVPACMLMGLPRFYQAGIVLAALYALYYHYPSEQRIGFDRRLFRVS